MIGILQTYHSIAAAELGHHRQASEPLDGSVVQWLRPGRLIFQDDAFVLGWVGVGAATVRAIDIHYRVHRLDQFEITGRDGVTSFWCGYDGPPVKTARDPGSYDVTVKLTSFPR